MIQLVFTVCSLVQGARCYPVEPIVLREEVTMFGCIIGGMQEAAKYAMNHPNFYVAKYTCEPLGKYTRM